MPSAALHGFRCAIFRSMDQQTLSLQHLPRSFELLTKYLLTLATFCVIVFLAFTVAEKGAPCFVRYVFIFTFRRSAAPVLSLCFHQDPDPVGTLSRSLPTIPLSPLAATLMDVPASVANKRLTVWLNPYMQHLQKTLGAHPSSQKLLSFLFWNVRLVTSQSSLFRQTIAARLPARWLLCGRTPYQ